MPNEAVNSLALIFFCKQFGTRSGLIGIETVWHSDGKHYIFLFEKADPEKISRRQRSALSEATSLHNLITSERETDKASKDKTSKRQKKQP